MPGRPGTVDTVRPSSGEGSYRVMNPAIFQSGTAHGRRPSYSCVNGDSGSLLRTVQLPGCWQYRVVCGKGKIVWEEQLLPHVEAGPARPVLSAFPLLPLMPGPTPGSTLSTRPPSWLVGWVVRRSQAGPRKTQRRLPKSVCWCLLRRQYFPLGRQHKNFQKSGLIPFLPVLRMKRCRRF